MPLTIAKLRENSEAADLLGRTFDFNVTRSFRVPEWYVIEGADGSDFVAADGSGDEYLIVRSSGRALYISHEGQTATLAANLDELLALIIALPYWQTVLKFSDGGKLEAMRETALICVDYPFAVEDEDIAEARQSLNAHFDLPVLADPVATLHYNVMNSAFIVRHQEGMTLQSLVGGQPPEALRQFYKKMYGG
jgi:hypothetical protein